MKFKFIATLSFVCVALLACAENHYAKVLNHQIETCHCEKCMDVKIGAMIMAGFKGVKPSDEIKHAICKHHIGGVILFDRDVSNGMGERNIQSPEQLKELTAKLRSFTRRPLMIAIDQEGGLVNRLKPKYGFPRTVSAGDIGKTGSLDTASHWAAVTAKMMVECGLDVNFVPCVDVNVNPENPIIGKIERSFSADPDSVYLFAARWVDEHHKRNIITSLKHFPGHGSSDKDSHLGLVDVTDTWTDMELEPYRQFVKNGYKGVVMVGHLINRNIDEEFPSSLSEKTINGILRKQIGFDGVIATDDMNMGAIVNHYSFEKALVLAINAGVNMIIVGNNSAIYEENLAANCHEMIKRNVANGEISTDKIDESYRRLRYL